MTFHLCHVLTSSDLIGNDKDSAELWTVIRQVLILSHGNASVESGFSV